MHPKSYLQKLLLESCSHQFSVQIQVDDKVSVEGPVLFNVFISDRDSGVKCTCSKSAGDTRLSVAADVPEVLDAILRDLDKLKK